jgi:hypothetical protein
MQEEQGVFHVRGMLSSVVLQQGVPGEQRVAFYSRTFLLPSFYPQEMAWDEHAEDCMI